MAEATAAGLEVSSGPRCWVGARWAPIWNWLSPFPGARPVGAVPRTMLAQVIWGRKWSCYKRRPEQTHFLLLMTALRPSIFCVHSQEFRIRIRKRGSILVTMHAGSALGTKTLWSPRENGGREKTSELVKAFLLDNSNLTDSCPIKYHLVFVASARFLACLHGYKPIHRTAQYWQQWHERTRDHVAILDNYICNMLSGSVFLGSPEDPETLWGQIIFFLIILRCYLPISFSCFQTSQVYSGIF